MAEGVRDIDFGLRVTYDEKASDRAFAQVEREATKLQKKLDGMFRIRPKFEMPDVPQAPEPKRGREPSRSADPGGGMATETPEPQSREQPAQRSKAGDRKTEIDKELDHELRQRAKAAEAAEKAAERKAIADSKAAE